MNDKVVRIEPTPMTFFSKIDCDPGFSIKLCNEASLFETVRGALFFGVTDSEQTIEVAETVEQLKVGRDVAFEDGWMSLRIGMADVTAYLMQKITEAKEEERYADGQRYKELEARRETELRYTILRQALIEALGDRVVELDALAKSQSGATLATV